MPRLPLAALLVLALAGPAAGQAPADTLEATWLQTLDNFDELPAVFALLCPPGGSLEKAVWGTDEYTDDSGLCVAAVHAGMIAPDPGGVAIVERRPGRDSYRGSARHGVTSRDYPAWPRGFRFVRAAAGVTADPADVASIGAIVAAFYAVVSGPVGAPRQWVRDSALYLPGATFAIIEPSATGPPTARVVTPAQFAAESDRMLVTSGFTEREIHREERRWGELAQVWSTYEWATADGGRGRGINALELVFMDGRWWIASAAWRGERPDDPVPDEYLPDD